MATNGPNLSSFVLIGWILVPLLFPKALWALLILTLIYAFTKFTETIVVEKGHLPSLYQCYYKALYCFKKRKLEKDDIIPYISSECAEVILNTQNMYDFDTLISNSFISYEHKDEGSFLKDRDVKAEKLRLSKEEERNKQIGDIPVSSSTIPESSSQLVNMIESFVKRKVVPVSRETVDEIQRINVVTDSTYKDMSYTYYHLPAFMMDFSSLTFNFFPLLVWSAQLVRVDGTILRNINRKTPLYCSSRISQSNRLANGDVEVVCINDFSAKLFDLLDAEQCRLQHITKDSVLVTYVASITHTYVFSQANASGVVTNVEDRESWQKALEALFTIVTKDKKKSTDYDIDITPDQTFTFATMSGNLHPRHFKQTYANIFGEKGNMVDGMFGSALAFGSLERTLHTSVFMDGPIRFCFELGVEADVQSPARLQSKVYDSIDISSLMSQNSLSHIIPPYPHIKERQLALERAMKRFEENPASVIDPSLKEQSIIEKLLPKDWKSVVPVELVTKEALEELVYVRGYLLYGAKQLPSLEISPEDIGSEQDLEE